MKRNRRQLYHIQRMVLNIDSICMLKMMDLAAIETEKEEEVCYAFRIFYFSQVVK